MANLVVNAACNLSCDFCFATTSRESTTSLVDKEVGVEEFRGLVDFIDDGPVRLCGGEPSVHSEFPTLLDVALDAPLRRVAVMTNAVWPDRALAAYDALDDDKRSRIDILVNALPSDSYRPAQHQRFLRTLAGLAPERVTVGLTLNQAGQPFEYIFELTKRFGFGHMRYSVAAPSVSDRSTWTLDPRRDYPGIADTIFDLVTRARAAGLRVHADCGYIPPCQFDPQKLAKLLFDDDDDVRFGCHGPTDIAGNDRAWSCYGLYGWLDERPSDHASADDLAATFDARRKQIAEQHLLFDECRTCEHLVSGRCMGGCHAQRVVETLRRQPSSELNAVRFERDSDVLRPFSKTKGYAVREHGIWSLAVFDDVERAVLDRLVRPMPVSAIVADTDARTAAAYTGALERLVDRGLVRTVSPRKLTVLAADGAFAQLQTKSADAFRDRTG